MDASMGIAGAFALGVALVLMYVVLRKYTYPAVEQPFFSDPSLFILFTVGLIEGTILFVAFTYIFQYYGDIGAGIVVAILFGIVLELVKLVTLNLRRYAGKSDTVFYGFGLGLGIGSAMGFGFIYYIPIAMENAGVEMDTARWVATFAIALVFILFNAGTGLRVGEGVARKRTTEFLMAAFLLGLAVQLLLVTPLNNLVLGNDIDALGWVTLVIAVIFTAVNLYVAVRVKLPLIIDDILKSQGKKRNDIPGL